MKATLLATLLLVATLPAMAATPEEAASEASSAFLASVPPSPAQRERAGVRAHLAALPVVNAPAVPDPVAVRAPSAAISVPADVGHLSCANDPNRFRTGIFMLEPRQGSFVASLRGDFGPSPDFQALAERLGLEHTYTPDDEATFAKNACARGQWTAADQWRCQGPVHLRLSGSATGDEASIEAKALLTVTFPRRAGGDWAVELTVEHEGRLFVDRVSFPSDRCRVGN